MLCVGVVACQVLHNTFSEVFRQAFNKRTPDLANLERNV